MSNPYRFHMAHADGSHYERDEQDRIAQLNADARRKTVNRFECSARYSQQNRNHDSGTGRPARKRSKCCGAEYRIETGLYGLFLHSSVSGSATYRADEALSLHRTAGQADKAADTSGYTSAQLAIRFVTDIEEN